MSVKKENGMGRFRRGKQNRESAKWKLLKKEIRNGRGRESGRIERGGIHVWKLEGSSCVERRGINMRGIKKEAGRGGRNEQQ